MPIRVNVQKVDRLEGIATRAILDAKDDISGEWFQITFNGVAHPADRKRLFESVSGCGVIGYSRSADDIPYPFFTAMRRRARAIFSEKRKKQ